VGQGQDPYGDAGGFTPYQPDPTPDSEPPAETAPPPFVPYGGDQPVVPYGGAFVSTYYTATPTTTSSGRMVLLGLVVGIGVLVASCGGGIAAIFGTIGGSDPGTSSGSGEVFVNDLVAGQCLNGAGFFTDEPVSALEIVDCASAHDVQVLEVNLLDTSEVAEYDFNDPDSAGEVCDPVLSAQQQQLVSSADYGLIAFTETGSPGVGDKVACLVRRADNKPIRGFLPAVTPESPA
jgi:hypothetical protein